ncbi:hypothetical protein D3C77_664320 [compost metagenome]
MGAKTVVEIANHVLNFALDHGFRNFNISVLAYFINENSFTCCFAVFLLTGKKLLLQILFILIKCIEFANILRELIIQLRKLFAFNFMYFHFEDSFFASQFFCMVCLRESYCNILEVASS